jgi:hypothetical protein
MVVGRSAVRVIGVGVVVVVRMNVTDTIVVGVIAV